MGFVGRVQQGHARRPVRGSHESGLSGRGGAPSALCRPWGRGRVARVCESYSLIGKNTDHTPRARQGTVEACDQRITEWHRLQCVRQPGAQEGTATPCRSPEALARF